MKNYRKDEFCVFLTVMSIVSLLVVLISLTVPYFFNNPLKIEQSIKLIFSGLTAVGTIGVAVFSVLTVFRHERKEKNNRLQEQEEQLRQKAYQAYEKIFSLTGQIEEIEYFFTQEANGDNRGKSILSYWTKDPKRIMAFYSKKIQSMEKDLLLTAAFIRAHLNKVSTFENGIWAMKDPEEGFFAKRQRANFFKQTGREVAPAAELKSFSILTIEQKEKLNKARKHFDEALEDLQKIMQNEDLIRLSQKQLSTYKTKEEDGT